MAKGFFSITDLWDRDCHLPGVTQHLAEWNCKLAASANYVTVLISSDCKVFTSIHIQLALAAN